MSVANSIDRLKSLIKYAKDAARLRTSPVQSVDNYKAHFLCHEAELSGLPGLLTNSVDKDGEEIWFKVERLSEIQPPVPNSGILVEWIEISKLPSIKPTLKTKIKRVAYLPTEPGKINSALQPRAYEDAFLEEQDNYVAIQQDYNLYLKEWTDWSSAEIPRRRTIALYGERYKLSQILQGDLTNTPLELVWGIGIGILKPETATSSFPLLTQLVEITLQESDMSLVIRPRAMAPKLELELYDQLAIPVYQRWLRLVRNFFRKALIR
jgi:hypothetical protein